jgi:hypothetical protein
LGRKVIRNSVLLSLWLCLFATAPSQELEQFQGLWWVAHGDGAPLQIRLYGDGSAWSDYSANNPGRWTVESQRMVCRWADDWKEVFFSSGPGRWVKWGYRPSSPLSEAPTNVSRAYRVSEAADGWFGVSP